MGESFLNIFSDSELDQLANATLSVLERAGVMYQSDAILDALEKAGASVDCSSQRARLPRRMIERIIERQKEGQKRQEGSGERRREPGPAEDGPLPGMRMQIAQFYYDHERGERRPGSREDLVRMVQLGDALDETGSVDQVLLLREERPEVEPLEGLLVLMEHTSRPGGTYPHFAAQFPYFEEIGEIYAGDWRRFLSGVIFMVSPLRMDRRACDYLVALTKRGLPCNAGTQPVGGVSAPVTRAGVIVLGAAEILGCWAAAVALNPEVPLHGSIESGAVDMGTANVHFGAPGPLMQDLGCVELFRRRLGGHVTVAGGADYTSAKFPGYQAGFEKALDAMAISAYAGGHARVGAGLLDSGKMFSPLQLLIDRECQSLLWGLTSGVPVNEEEIALEAITSVASGIGRSYLDSEHTLEHYRRSLWFARLFDRTVWREGGDEARPDEGLLERAQAQLREAMSRYRPPEVDQDMLTKVTGVVERARRELVGGGE